MKSTNENKKEQKKTENGKKYVYRVERIDTITTMNTTERFHMSAEDYLIPRRNLHFYRRMTMIDKRNSRVYYQS